MIVCIKTKCLSNLTAVYDQMEEKLTMGLATPTLTDYHYEHIECSKYQPIFAPTCFVEAIDSLC